MNFGAILGGIGKVANIALGIFKVAKPLLEAMRPAVDEVDDAFVFIGKQIDAGGVIADDFLDRNIDTILTLEHASGKGQVVMGKINALAVALRVASQESTPDTITEAEALALGKQFIELRTMLDGWKPDLDAAILKLNAVD